MRTSLRIEGQREAARRLDDVGTRARRPEPALRSDDVRTAIQEGQRRRFSHNRGWPRASDEWAARKRRMGRDPRLMRFTGALESALTNATGETRLNVFNMTLTWGLRWRSSTYYAAVQAKKYRRRSVVIDRGARSEIARMVERYIAGTWS